MNTKLLPFFRLFTNHFEKDVFKSTQNRLTRNFGGLIMLFLILFIAIVYSVPHVVILNNQERELQSLVTQEANFIENYLVKNNQIDLHGIQNQEVVFAGVNQYFYYVVNPSGELIMGSEANPRLRQDLLHLVNSGLQNKGEIRNETLHMDGNPKGRGNKGEFRSPDAAQDIHLMMASRSIFYNGEYIGQLTIGKDVTYAYQLFQWVLIILIVLGIVFVGVVIFLSTGMSRRAMVPINAAFTRQREFVGDASHELRTPLSVYYLLLKRLK